VATTPGTSAARSPLPAWPHPRLCSAVPHRKRRGRGAEHGKQRPTPAVAGGPRRHSGIQSPGGAVPRIRALLGAAVKRRPDLSVGASACCHMPSVPCCSSSGRHARTGSTAAGVRSGGRGGVGGELGSSRPPFAASCAMRSWRGVMGVVEAMELRRRQLTRARARRGGMIRSLALDFFLHRGFVVSWTPSRVRPVPGEGSSGEAEAMMCSAGSISASTSKGKGTKRGKKKEKNGTEYHVCAFTEFVVSSSIMVSRGEVCCWLTSLHGGECAMRPRLQGTVAFRRRGNNASSAGGGYASADRLSKNQKYSD
jgi:hypothetical protein